MITIARATPNDAEAQALAWSDQLALRPGVGVLTRELGALALRPLTDAEAAAIGSCMNHGWIRHDKRWSLSMLGREALARWSTARGD